MRALVDIAALAVAIVALPVGFIALLYGGIWLEIAALGWLGLANTVIPIGYVIGLLIALALAAATLLRLT